MKTCDICKDKFEGYLVNTFGCCSTKFCVECFDKMSVEPNCTVCKKENRFYKRSKSIEEQMLDILYPVDRDSSIPLDFFKNIEYEDCLEIKKILDGDDKYKDFRRLMQLLNYIDDADTVEIDFEFYIKSEFDNSEYVSQCNLEFGFKVEDEEFDTAITRSYEPQARQIERKYAILGGFLEMLQNIKLHSGFRMLLVMAENLADGMGED